jgi:hypothetical protein
MKNKMAELLTRGGKPAEMWKSPDGSTAVVMSHGGRILALFTPDSERNFFWNHPALESPASLMAFYRDNAWHNSGGDRTWLSPEIDFFLPKYPDLDTYVQPRELDPGNYVSTKDHAGFTLTNRVSLIVSRTGTTVDLELSKRLLPAMNPLRNHAALATIEYAGYTLVTKLAYVARPESPAKIGIWNLLQLPPGGEFLIPTCSSPAVSVYFGIIDEGIVKTSSNLSRCIFPEPGNYKAGFDPLTSIGRIGYLYSDGMDRCLIVRNFAINPSGDYVDAPHNSSSPAGSAIQICSVNGEIGRFSEIEYHTPAIGGAEGELSREDESQLWAFRGTERDVLDVARTLISCEV